MDEALTYPGGSVRLFVEDALAPQAKLVLNAKQSHYVVRVMRGRAGGTLRLFNGRDGEWLAEISVAEPRAVALTCRARTRGQCEVPDLWLLFSPIKRIPADYLAQKATELGVRALQPVITRRSNVSRVNSERLRANAVEAAEQSDRVSVPEIRPTTSFANLLSTWPPGRLLFFCDEAGDAGPFAEAAASARGEAFAI
ncbi:MAG: 16S rRNA (uracil(1498)-N(3))-methyltransferase, partial [Alphaproteobacteria bacterium]|nr:16S rRNA (uracil(1498)-N(3))-methyltransferase [Alphaproteobacteria bacterium]